MCCLSIIQQVQIIGAARVRGVPGTQLNEVSLDVGHKRCPGYIGRMFFVLQKGSTYLYFNQSTQEVCLI